MALFSFDIESTYDAGEMNNVYDQALRELSNRFDLKGTQASLEWLEDKKGFKLCGDNQFHLDAVIDIIRKKAASRNVSQKTFNTDATPETTNLRMIWTVPFRNGLSQDDAKKISKLLREELPKIKSQIQGDALRVMGAKKDELQAAMQLVRQQDYPFPVIFTNYR